MNDAEHYGRRMDAAIMDLRRLNRRMDAVLEDLRKTTAERDRYRKALIACATAAGADVSGGPPTSPGVDEWALEQVRELRADHDEAGAEIFALEQELQHAREPMA